MDDEYEELIAMWSRNQAAIPFPAEAVSRVLEASYPARDLSSDEKFRMVEAADRIQRAAECYIEFCASPARQSKQPGRPVYIEERLGQVADAASKLADALDELFTDGRRARARGHPVQAWQLEGFAEVLDQTLSGDLVTIRDHAKGEKGQRNTVARVWALGTAALDRVFKTDPAGQDFSDKLRIRRGVLLTPGRLRGVALTVQTFLKNPEFANHLKQAKTGGGQRPTNVAVRGLIKQLADIYAMLWQTPPSAKSYYANASPKDSRYLAFVRACFDELVRLSQGVVVVSDFPSESTIQKWSEAER